MQRLRERMANSTRYTLGRFILFPASSASLISDKRVGRRFQTRLDIPPSAGQRSRRELTLPAAGQRATRARSSYPLRELALGDVTPIGPHGEEKKNGFSSESNRVWKISTRYPRHVSVGRGDIHEQASTGSWLEEWPVNFTFFFGKTGGVAHSENFR